jgi:sporulation protein YlmC with PRC-barrel domain
MKTQRIAVASFVSAVALTGALAGALAALAQQTSQRDQAGQSDQSNQNSASADSQSGGAGGNQDIGKLDDKTRGATIRASQLIGQDIKNSKGDNVGEIKDLVIDSSGKIRYAAVTYGGFLGVGSKLFAVPFEAFQVRQDPSDRDNRSAANDRNNRGDANDRNNRSDANNRGDASNREDRGDYVLTLDVTKDQLEGAQGFDNDRWPDFADTKMAQELDRRYNVNRSQADRSQAERSQNRDRSRQ